MRIIAVRLARFAFWRGSPKTGPKEQPLTADPIIESASETSTSEDLQLQLDAIRARGFLRNRLPWNPPVDVESIVLNVIKSEAALDSIENCSAFQFSSLDQKSRILLAVEKQLNRAVPNSLLNEIRGASDLLEFYRKPVRNVTSYEELARSENKPKNLHVIEQPIQFHPEKDKYFDGVTAFPKSSTIMVHPRNRRIYGGFRAKTEWEHFQDKHFEFDKPPKHAPWVDKNPFTVSKEHPYSKFKPV